MSRWRHGLVVGALLGAACFMPSWPAAADVLPPPPDCTADSAGQPCTVDFFRDPSVEGTCFFGDDDAAYCRAGTTCFPAEPPAGSSDNVGVPCPAEATSDPADEDDAEGCALRPSPTGPSLVGLLSVCALGLAVWRRRQRRSPR